MIHVYREIRELYQEYLSLLPLNISNDDYNGIKRWRKSIQLSILDFCRVVHLISNNKNINCLTHGGIDLDFDNIAPVIQVLHKFGYLRFKADTSYECIGLPAPVQINKDSDFLPIYRSPDPRYNQFPCTIGTRLGRIEKLVHDYPYVASMRVGLLGDDDLLSIDLATYTPFTPIVIEKDEHVVEYLAQCKMERKCDVEIFKGDIVNNLNKNTSFDTFITDPPYTLYGILWFLYRGLSLLETKDRIYMVANQMMLGGKVLSLLFRLIGQAGLIPVEIIPAFNEYPLPLYYREMQDWAVILTNLGGKPTGNMMSSASTLYVFQTKYVQEHVLEQVVTRERNIYPHRKIVR